MKLKVLIGKSEPGRDLYRLADNLSVHYFGNKSEHLYENDIPRNLYNEEFENVKKGLGNILEGKPQELQSKMIRGKMMKFLKEKAMESQTVGFEESEQTIGEYLQNIQKKTGKVKITSAQRFGV